MRRVGIFSTYTRMALLSPAEDLHKSMLGYLSATEVPLLLSFKNWAEKGWTCKYLT